MVQDLGFPMFISVSDAQVLFKCLLHPRKFAGELGLFPLKCKAIAMAAILMVVFGGLPIVPPDCFKANSAIKS